MPRPMAEILAHIRAVVNDPAISTTLIQTADLVAMCDAIDPPQDELSPLVEEALTPHPWKVQSFDYYAAHFLVGCGLVHGDLYGHVKALAAVLQTQYEIGVEHGMKTAHYEAKEPRS